MNTVENNKNFVPDGTLTYVIYKWFMVLVFQIFVSDISHQLGPQEKK